MRTDEMTHEVERAENCPEVRALTEEGLERGARKEGPVGRALS